MWSNFGQQIYDNIVYNQRYLLYIEGLGRTVVITLGALAIGLVIGSLVAIVKIYGRDGGRLRTLMWLCDVYITFIRGTPVTVQLLIMYYVVFTKGSGVLIAIAAFGLNSGAYVAEIIRAGILAVDRGQTEAGRSLGLTQNSTMALIVMPQAIKNILPALGNEMIVLLKETAIVGYIAVEDLTKLADLIRSRTWSPVPLLFTALIYLCVVLLMTFGLRNFERWLAKSDTR